MHSVNRYLLMTSSVSWYEFRTKSMSDLLKLVLQKDDNKQANE